MSEVDLYTRLRQLRQKVMALIKNLPDIALSQLQPEVVEFGELFGKTRLLAPSQLEYDMNIRAPKPYLADSSGNKITSVFITPDYASYLLDKDTIGETFSYIVERNLPFTVHMLNTNTNTEEVRVIELEHQGLYKISFENIDNIIYNAYPLDYEPDQPLQIECYGAYWNMIEPDGVFDMHWLSGRCGYLTNGKILQWNGVALYLGVNLDGWKVTVITPRGRLEAQYGEAPLLIATPIWSIYAKMAVLVI